MRLAGSLAQLESQLLINICLPSKIIQEAHSQSKTNIIELAIWNGIIKTFCLQLKNE